MIPGKLSETERNSLMATSEQNDLTQGLRGKFGKQLIFKSYSYGTVVSRPPDMSNVKLSAKQRASNKLFRDAVAFAKSVIADPVKRKKYERSLEPGKTVYAAALSDYMKRKKPK